MQYRESDLAFVSRLFEEVGIYYYFTHEESKHTLVLADSLAAHGTATDYETLPYRAPDAHRDALIEHVRSWQMTERIQSAAVAARDFNFVSSRADLTAQATSPEEHVVSDGELFDFPVGYPERALGDIVVRRQIEIMSASNLVAKAETNARGLLVGNLFSLTEHPVDTVNLEYLVTSAHYQLAPHDSRAAHAHEEVYSCTFTAMESSRVYRPARSTRKPIMRGLHTAFVVGKEGEEIWTDEYGRVKVQFHWDRYGEFNDDSSCWVRARGSIPCAAPTRPSARVPMSAAGDSFNSHSCEAAEIREVRRSKTAWGTLCEFASAASCKTRLVARRLPRLLGLGSARCEQAHSSLPRA